MCVCVFFFFNDMVSKRVLRYLKGTISHGISCKPSHSLSLQSFADADYASCPDDRRSTGACCVYLGKCLVSWCSEKQTVVARSTTESEYRALALVSVEILWLVSLLSELRVELPYFRLYGVITQVQHLWQQIQ